MRNNIIKNHIKRTLRSFVSKSSYKLKRFRLKEPFVRVLMYHEVEDNPSHAFCVSTFMFDKQMQYLKANYQIISVHEMLAFLKGDFSLKRNSVVVTFDDGLRCIYLNAYPILKKYNIPATIFLVSDYLKLGKDARSGKEFLRVEDIKKMQKNGISLGSHAKDHICLSGLSESQLRENIYGSKIELENMLEERIDFFAYPYGLKRHFNVRAKALVREAGYKCAFSAINGVNYYNSDLYALRRSKVEKDDSSETFKHILEGGLDIWALID